MSFKLLQGEGRRVIWEGARVNLVYNIPHKHVLIVSFVDVWRSTQCNASKENVCENFVGWSLLVHVRGTVITLLYRICNTVTYIHV